MKNDEFEKYLNKVRNNISNLHNRFYIWRGLLNKDYNKIYNKNKYFWASVVYSLDKLIIIDLSKLFEQRNEWQEKRYGKGINLYRLMEFIEDESKKNDIEKKINEEISKIESIKGWRDKLIAHEDEDVFLNMDSFYEEYSLKHADIEDLIELSKKILGDITTTVTKEGHSYTFETFRREGDLDIKTIMKKLSED